MGFVVFVLFIVTSFSLSGQANDQENFPSLYSRIRQQPCAWVEDENNLRVIDCEAKEEIAKIEIKKKYYKFGFIPENDHLYFISPYAQHIDFFDLRQWGWKTPLPLLPSNHGFPKTFICNNYLWVFHPGDPFFITGANLLTFKALRPFKAEKGYKKGIVTPKGDYIVAYSDSRLSVFNASTYQRECADFILSHEPTLFVPSLNGKYLFIEEGQKTALHCLNLQTLQKEKSIQKDNKFQKFFFTADGKFALALYNSSQSLSILNLSSLYIEKNLELQGKKGYGEFHFIDPYLLIEKRETFSLLNFNFNHLTVEYIFKDYLGNCKIQGSKAFILEATQSSQTLREVNLVTHYQRKIDLKNAGSIFSISPFHPYILFTHFDMEYINYDFSNNYFYTPRQVILFNCEKRQSISLELPYKVQGVHFFGKERRFLASACFQKMFYYQHLKKLTDIRFIF